MSKASFSQQYRVRKKSHFEYIYTQGHKLENAVVRLYCAPRLADRSCFAFVASKRVGNAVVRNACKRRLKEILRLNASQIPQGDDIVLVAKTTLIQRSYQDAQHQIIRLMRQRLNPGMVRV